MKTTYTIKKIDYLDDDLRNFLRAELPTLALKYNNVFDPNFAAVEGMIQKGVFFVCRRNEEITGFHVSWLVKSPLDMRLTLLQQQIFYVKPGSGRSAYHLFEKFVDYGEKHADYIISMVGKHTNIKPSTLKNRNFEEIETVFRMKVEK